MQHTVQYRWSNDDDGVTVTKVRDLHIIVDDTVDMGNVKATGGHVSTHQYTA